MKRNLALCLAVVVGFVAGAIVHPGITAKAQVTAAVKVQEVRPGSSVTVFGNPVIGLSCTNDKCYIATLQDANAGAR
jgi:hypothetical protein